MEIAARTTIATRDNRFLLLFFTVCCVIVGGGPNNVSSFAFERIRDREHFGAPADRRHRDSAYRFSDAACATNSCASSSSSTRLSSATASSTATETPQQQQQQHQQQIMLPWRDTNFSPFTGTELRNLVVEAAMKEEDESFADDDDDDDDDFLDVPGVAWMEHLNLIVGNDRPLAEAFYIDVLGMTADKSKSFHVNLGRQQFHLATPQTSNDEIPHRIHGSVGLVVPDLEALWDRLGEAIRDDDDNRNSKRDSDSDSNNRHDFRGTLFDFYRETADDGDSTVHVRCPWGNVFRCYSADVRGRHRSAPVAESTMTPLSPQMMTNLHAQGIGVHGADKMGVLGVGQPGIRFVEFVLPVGVRADKIRSFYRSTLRCPATVLSTGEGGVGGKKACLVSVGPGVHLVFAEASASAAAELDADAERDLYRRMKGIHVCIYAHDFRGLYRRLRRRSLIWTNPRFTRLDRCDTWEDAKRSRTLRFRHIVDDDDVDDDDDTEPDRRPGGVLMELEHETRPLRHGQFMKVPYYEPN